MTTSFNTQTPTQKADETIRTILQSQWDGVGALRIDSPPGAGKTYIVELLAAQSLELLKERCMIATQTNAQALDLARRLASGFGRLTIHLFCRDGLPLPDELVALPNLCVIHQTQQLPSGPCVVIANGAKWSWVGDGVEPFDLQIVDEAFQMPDFRFHQIAGLARRVVLIGDPGQIGPVITCEIERWRDDPAGPHVPCPCALLHRYPSVAHIRLPVSRRLPADTVRFIQPAFYPEMAFEALTGACERALLAGPSRGDGLDRAIDGAAKGHTLQLLTLPARVTGEMDEALTASIVALIERLLSRGTRIIDRGVERKLTPEMIGVACAHVVQVSAVRERLGAAFDGLYVETSDRFQGLERPVMIVQHPLSGRADADAFHLDAGRLCVMLSRHRNACFVLSRAGLLEMLTRHAPGGERILDIEEDTEYEGWKAHHALLSSLVAEGRVLV